LAAGGKTTTGWYHEQRNEKRIYVVTVQHSYPETNATERAVAVLKKVKLTDRHVWEAVHRKWWHDYYEQSFVSIGDTVWESYYWIQMYKLACAARSDRALIDNQGPWLQPTGWNGTWWNLNIQLSYSPVATANRLDIGKSLTGHLERNFQTLIENVEPQYRHDSAGISRNTAMDLKGMVGKPGGWDVGERDIGCEVGNLTWTCHNVYMMYRHSMDEGLRDRLLYPLLKRCVNYYGHFLYKGDDGRLHLPETHSPEYGNAADANYDIALLRWGCLTLIELAKERNADEPLRSEWERILENLVGYPVNENGFMIGDGVGFDRSHRHWSHMLMVYPLRVVTPDKDEALIRKSLARWHSFPNALAGYSYTGGASFSAFLGDGDKALEYMNGYLRFMGASTMYYEGGSQGLPVMETPLHGSQAIQEMLLQSWGGVVRVFPALPSKWKDVSFSGLLAEGAFEVSTVRSNGVTQWVAIRSLAGQKCVVEIDITEPAATVNGKARQLKNVGDNRYELSIMKGEQAVISSAATLITKTVVGEVQTDENINYFGLNSRRNAKK
ncbi:MAG: hypothetical protein KAS23_05240, partial [Anaerohalosphaera sp.]|nr:hypothetical protein [Anaerohalosphaera sp.]